jgi:hypothetical protein
VLPLNFKYNTKIFDAIISEFFQTNEADRDPVGYRELYRRTSARLGHKISFRDYDSHIDFMTAEGILSKYDPTGGRRGAKVYLSLSDKAKKKSSLKILGVDKKIQKRKTLYQLLIFFEIFKRTNLITQRQLEGFLGKIGSSLNNLKAIKTSHTNYPRITVFEPIKSVEIVKYIQSDFKLGYLADTSYYIVIPGFTVKELFCI